MAGDPLDRELEEMAGSPQLARAVRESLRRLRSGSAGPELAEMAGDVLAGRTDLRGVARSSAYASQLTEGVARYKRWEAELTEEERNHLQDQARRAVYGSEEPD